MVDVQILHMQALKSFIPKIRGGKIFFFLLLSFLLTQHIFAQTTVKYSTGGSSSTYTVPSGVSYIIVECWGAGGGGAQRSNSGSYGGGGGGGGAYARKIIYNPTGSYTVYVGKGGVSNTTNGENSYFGTIVVAEGGKSVSQNTTTGGSGGSASNSTGDVTYSGGTGGTGSGSYGGGGGSSASPAGDGISGSNSTGGKDVSPYGGGNGADGPTSSAVGIAGIAPGGGGSGALRTSGGPKAGGDGAAGQVIITYFAPGGVSGASLWLRSDWGTSSSTDATALSSWKNNMDGVNVTQATAAQQPLFRTGSSASSPASPFNFNPAISFDGTNDYFKGAGNYGINGNIAFTTLAVGRTKSKSQINAIWGGENSSSCNTTFQIYHDTDGNFPNGAAIDQWGLFPLAGGGAVHTEYDPFLSEEAISSSISDSYNNGILDNGVKNSRTGFGTSYPTNTIVDIGARLTTGSLYFNGDLAEVLIFNKVLSPTETQKVNSYLGIKYGFTLGNGVPTIPYAATLSYLASDGSTVYWDMPTNSGYSYNVAGIARDDVSGLYQKQSKTINNTLAVVMGNSSTIASDNASNTSTISADKSALMWGDNNGSFSIWTTTGIPTDFQIGGNSLAILSRTWKVQKTGTIGTVKVQVPDDRSSLTYKLPNVPISGTTSTYPNYNVYLLVDGDGIFTSGAKAIKMKYNDTTKNWEVNYNFNSTYPYFTFAKGPRFIESNKFLSGKPYAAW